MSEMAVTWEPGREVHEMVIEDDKGTVQCLTCGRWSRAGRAVLDRVPCIPLSDDVGDTNDLEVKP